MHLRIPFLYVGPPSIPSVIVVEVTLDSLSVSWDSFSHDACGDVTYNVTLSDGMQSIADDITTDNSMHFTDLNNDTLYKVSVSATNDAGQGPSISISATTLTPAGIIIL